MNKVDKNKQQVVPGNLTLIQAGDIATKYGMKILIPATLIIGRTENMHSKDRLIYTDKATNKLIVKKEAITIFQARQFIDDHILKKNPRQPGRVDSVIPPKYILKIVDKSGASDTRVFYCKNQLVSCMMEAWGSMDLILQPYIH